jgi:tocopherol O-methyltransferase
VTDRSYRGFLLDPRSRNRVFALTLVRLVLAYRTGSMRYGLMLARRP